MFVLRVLRTSLLALGSLFVSGGLGAHALTVVPQLTLTNGFADDQDDLCVWIHPAVGSLSTIITSDKSAERLFVYDLQGNVVQNLAVSGKPGNIDVRYGFPLNGDILDIVVFNNRTSDRLHVYKVSHVTRQLTRIDGDNLSIGANYGAGLYRSHSTGTFHVFTTSETGTIRHYELFDGGGSIAHSLIRTWAFSGRTESCVCDDESGQAFFGEEAKGIWKIGAEPSDPTSGTLIAEVGDASGLGAEVEGLAIYYAGGGTGYLFASSQGQDRYHVYARAAPHAYVAQFDIFGVTAADGIDVTNVPLGTVFPSGMFASHDDSGSPKPVQVCAYEDLDLPIDTGYWNPRQGPPTFAPTPGAATHATVWIDSRPNPFHGDTRIRYSLAAPAIVALDVYDTAGRLVRRLIDRHASDAGVYTLSWDGRDTHRRPVTAGVYFYRLETERGTVTGKATIVR